LLNPCVALVCDNIKIAIATELSIYSVSRAGNKIINRSVIPSSRKRSWNFIRSYFVCHQTQVDLLDRKVEEKILADFLKPGQVLVLTMSKTAFCIFIDTVCEGRIPAWHDENLMPVVYPTLEAAQREIADDVMEKLRQFLDGQRDFDDAMTVEDYILPVDVLADGSILDENGNCFGRKED
jgi:hypothetical protein